MAVLGFKYKDGRVVCYDCFIDEEDAKIEGLITDRDAKYEAYYCDECGRSIC